MALFGNNTKHKGASGAPQAPPRVADDATVKRAREALEERRQQVARVSADLDAAQAQLAALEVGALDGEQRGEDVVGPLGDAQRRGATLAGLFATAERGERDARAALEQALAGARARLAPEHVRRVIALLDELERGLWQVRDLQDSIHSAVMDAFREEIDIGVGAARYWSAGFPGFPWLRQDEEIMNWLRFRSLAPRWRSMREEGRC